MGISFKHALLRVSAFAVVGIAIVISTQILRGQNPAEAVDRVVQNMRHAALRALQDPASTAPPASQELAAASDQIAAELPPLTAPKVTTLAEAQVNAPQPKVVAECAKRQSTFGAIVIGDKIQLRFFAKVAMPSGNISDMATPMVDIAAFERLDLSGTYEVAEDGTTALPLIGRMDVAGHDLLCLEAMVANAIAAQDSSVTAVTGMFIARLPLTISGAVRAPGTYVYTPGMTVNRLINQAGASFDAGPISPQDFAGLVAQRDELQRRQIIAVLTLGRLKASMAGVASIDAASGVLVTSPTDLVAPLLAIETAALQQDLSVDQMTRARSATAIAGQTRQLKDIRDQLSLVTVQVANLQERLDQMNALKSRGLLQSSNPDVTIASLMELNRIKLQLEADQSALASRIDLARQDAQLAVQLHQQAISQQAAALVGQIGLFEVQRAAMEARLAVYGLGASGNAPLSLVVSVQRAEIDGVYQFDASLDTLLLPGDMVSVLLPANTVVKQVTAENAPSSGSDLTETDPAQQ